MVPMHGKMKPLLGYLALLTPRGHLVNMGLDLLNGETEPDDKGNRGLLMCCEGKDGGVVCSARWS